METYEQYSVRKNGRLSQREITKMISNSWYSIAKMIQAAIVADIIYEDIRELTEGELKEKLFPNIESIKFCQQPELNL